MTVCAGRTYESRTPRVFCDVTAVTAVAPYTPIAAKVLRSAWIPAPPPLSLPAMLRTFGIGEVTIKPRVMAFVPHEDTPPRFPIHGAAAAAGTPPGKTLLSLCGIAIDIIFEERLGLMEINPRSSPVGP